MTTTGDAKLNEDRREELKRRVCELAQKVMQGIDDGTVDGEAVGIYEWAVSVWMSEKGWGLWPIFPSDWQRLVEANDLSDIGIDEMIHDGLQYYFDIEKPLEFWADDDDTD